MYPNVHCNNTEKSQDMEASQMSTYTQMGEEVVVHKYNEMLFRYKKGINVSSGELDEPRVCYTE